MSTGSRVHQLFLQSIISEGVLSLEDSKQLYKKAARACGGKLLSYKWGDEASVLWVQVDVECVRQQWCLEFGEKVIIKNFNKICS